MSDQAPVTLREEDFDTLRKAAGDDLPKLLKALNLNQQIVSQALAGLAASYALGDRWRLKEGPYPTSSSPVCVLVQNRIGASWKTVRAFAPDGSEVAPPNQPAKLTVGTNWTVSGVDLRKTPAGLVSLAFDCIAGGAGGSIIATLPLSWAPAVALTVPLSSILNSGGPTTGVGFFLYAPDGSLRQVGGAVGTGYWLAGTWQATPGA